MLEEIWKCDQSALSSCNTPDILQSRPFIVATEHVFNPPIVSLVVVNVEAVSGNDLAERQVRRGDVFIRIVIYGTGADMFILSLSHEQRQRQERIQDAPVGLRHAKSRLRILVCLA